MFSLSVLRLRHISLQNWFRVRSAELDFPEYGLVLVLGQNHTATSRLDSVGSGKTALGEAINAAVFGPRDDMTGYSLNEAGNTLVTLAADLDDRPLKIEAGYKHSAFTSSGEGLRFTLEGNPVERPRVKQTRQELSDVVGLAPEAAPWTVFLDGERLRFNRLGQADALELLMQALGQPPWHVYQDKARVAATAAAKDAAVATAALATNASNLQETVTLIEQRQAQVVAAETAYQAAVADAAARTAEAKQQVEALTERLRVADSNRSAILLKIKAVQEADAVRFGEVSVELSRLESERATAARYIRQWDGVIATTTADLRTAKEQTKAADSRVCPTCRRAIDPDQEDMEIAKLAEVKVTELSARLNEEQAQRSTCEASLADIDLEIKDARQRQGKLHSAELKTLSDSFEGAEREIRRLDQQLRTAENLVNVAPPSDAAVVAAKARLDECVSREAELKERASVLAAKLAEAEQAERIANYWVRGFSPEGIPNLVLRQTVGPLNEAARLIGEALSGGAIQVQFEASAELADGRTKPKLVTRVINKYGAKRLSGNSKGEAGLANLIIAETQTHVGRVTHRVGYRWFDEVVNTQDPSVRRSFYSYLKRQAHERKLLIFVVDHHADATGFADKTIIAEKSADGFTTYRWA